MSKKHHLDRQKPRKSENNTKLTSRHKDIQSFFEVQPKTTGANASQTNAIELSDTEAD